MPSQTKPSQTKRLKYELRKKASQSGHFNEFMAQYAPTERARAYYANRISSDSLYSQVNKLKK